VRIISPDFIDAGRIPERFTCEGEDVSPTLIIQNVPEDAVSLCLILDDPDAPGGTFSHWVVYNLPITLERLNEGVSFDRVGSGEVREGVNGFGRKGYNGPGPPRGAGEHRYYFHLYALDSELALPDDVTRAMVVEKIRKGILEEAVLLGRFSRN
jgi:Raf kinase inhibitor-like YbhB/YbcL family protein